MESSKLLLKVMIAFAQPPFWLDLEFSIIIGKNNAFLYLWASQTWARLSPYLHLMLGCEFP